MVVNFLSIALFFMLRGMNGMFWKKGRITLEGLTRWTTSLQLKGLGYSLAKAIYVDIAWLRTFLMLSCIEHSKVRLLVLLRGICMPGICLHFCHCYSYMLLIKLACLSAHKLTTILFSEFRQLPLNAQTVQNCKTVPLVKCDAKDRLYQLQEANKFQNMDKREYV